MMMKGSHSCPHRRLCHSTSAYDAISPSMLASSKRRLSSPSVVMARIIIVLLYLVLLHLLVDRTNGWTTSSPPYSIRTKPRDISAPLYSTSRSRRHENRSPSYWEDDTDEPGRRRRDRSDPKNPFRDDGFDDENSDYYDDTFDSYYSDPQQPTDELTWESCPTEDSGTAHVLLPPPDQRGPPTCIVHFVGGTFFGSSPHVWYHHLLMDLVKHSSVAVVATSIPVTLLRSPLQHVDLARKLTKQFRVAYNNVLLDEYGPKALQNVPVCGLGHSLGSRLLVVATTLSSSKTNHDNVSRAARGGEKTSMPPNTIVPTPDLYKSLILMSFTNFGAAVGIPGVGRLYQASRNVERNNDQPLSPPPRSRRRQQRRSSRRGEDYNDCLDDHDDEYSDYDEDIDLWTELTSAVKESTRWIQSSLTPEASQLELHPTPSQLWDAVTPTELGGAGRYRIPQTLLVQFDQDRVDQSAKLAGLVENCTSIKFARLRGHHLSPVTPITQKGIQFLRGRADQPKQHESALRDLRQTIVRYVTEIVTKE